MCGLSNQQSPKNQARIVLEVTFANNCEIALQFLGIWDDSGGVMKEKQSEVSKYTAFRCPIDLLMLAKSLAKKERRSLSNFIITLLAKETDKIPSEEKKRVLEAATAPKKKRAVKTKRA